MSEFKEGDRVRVYISDLSTVVGTVSCLSSHWVNVKLDTVMSDGITTHKSFHLKQCRKLKKKTQERTPRPGYDDYKQPKKIWVKTTGSLSASNSKLEQLVSFFEPKDDGKWIEFVEVRK